MVQLPLCRAIREGVSDRPTPTGKTSRALVGANLSVPYYIGRRHGKRGALHSVGRVPDSLLPEKIFHLPQIHVQQRDPDANSGIEAWDRQERPTTD